MEAVIDKVAENANPKLDRAAREVLKFIGTLDPQWETRIEIIKTDNNFTDLQALGAMCGRVLDAGEHTIVPAHPYFQPGYVASGSTASCPICAEAYSPTYPGQPLCGKFECAAKHYKLKTAKDVEQDIINERAAFEERRKQAIRDGLPIER